MTDWADEIAITILSNVLDNWAEEPRSKQIERIAFDIRKAKADGVRDAIDKVYSELIVMADVIERGGKK